MSFVVAVDLDDIAQFRSESAPSDIISLNAGSSDDETISLASTIDDPIWLHFPEEREPAKEEEAVVPKRRRVRRVEPVKSYYYLRRCAAVQVVRKTDDRARILCAVGGDGGEIEVGWNSNRYFLRSVVRFRK
jgi:hypothetical protein